MTSLFANFPAPEWLETLLAACAILPSLNVVLNEILSNPSDTIGYCSILSTGRFYASRGGVVEFLPAQATPMYDIDLDDNVAIEVKAVEDVSLWNHLIAQGRAIPSNYVVEIETDSELMRPQLSAIVQRLNTTLATLAVQRHEDDQPYARLTYIRDTSANWTRIIPSTREGDDLNEFASRMRLAVSERINAAKVQLRVTECRRVLVLDAMKSYFGLPEVLDDVFCGTELWGPSGVTRAADGVLSQPGVFDGLDAIVVFVNGAATRVYVSPSITSPSALAKLGPLFLC